MIPYLVYILACADGSLYTGISNNVERRLKEHNKGTASKYTRARLPVNLVYLENTSSKSEALKREAQIKKLTRKEKINLINNNSWEEE